MTGSKTRNTLLATAAALSLSGLAEASDRSETEASKAVVGQALKALFVDFDAEAAAPLLAEDYIQHNPDVPTGAAAVLGFLPTLKEMGLSADVHRIIGDGDLVALHSTYHNAQAFGGDTLVAFDVFRVENGKIAEHWDNLTPVTPANPSGRTQVDGPTEVTDLNQTEANKDKVRSFVEDVLIGGGFDKLTDYISTETYLQHNSQIGDGLDGLGAALAAMAEQGITMQYDTLHKVIGEGNFVLTLSEGQMAGAHSAFYDLFRLEEGLIVEHWDVIQPIPSEMAHDNGKF